MLQLPNPIPIDPAWLPECSVEDLQKKHHIKVKFSRGEKKMLRRKRKIKPSRWAERHIILPEDAPIEGKWRNITTAYLADVMDASFFSSVQEIVVCAAPQTGKTQCVANCIGYTIDRIPGNVLFVFPVENDAKDYSKDRLSPMINDSRRIRSYLTGYDDDEASLRIKLRHLKMYLAWANSASRLAMRPLPYVVADEEDKYPQTTTKKEGTPVDLARKRTRNFPHKRKVWRLSSPTIENFGIWKALTEETEVIFDYFVKCPECGAMQKMIFDKEHFKWPGGSGADPKEVEREKSAWYECEKCNAKWDDTQDSRPTNLNPNRDQAVRDGEYRSREENLEIWDYLKKHKPRVIGFHIPAWLSPFVSLSECAAAFLKGLKDKNKLKDFNNGFAAEPWKIYDKERSEDRILALRDDRPRGRVPGGGMVAGLLAGVDTQDYGLWYRIRAFGYGGEELLKECWGVREGYLAQIGNDAGSDFRALKKVLWEDEYLDADGNRYPVLFTIQDALGHRTSEVYDFCRKHRGKIIPSFGRDVMAQEHTWRNLEYYPGGKKPIPGGLKAINVNTKYYKDELARLLEIFPGDPGAWHENCEFNEDFARHMTAEYVNEKGLWECPPNKENHLWDCAVLCLVAADVLGIKHWAKEEQAKTDKTPGRKVRSRGI